MDRLHNSPRLESSSSPLSSSAKMDPPIRSSGNVPQDPRIQQERPPSPTQSYLSIRTDRSMDRPVSFKEDFACEPRVQVERAGSPLSACMSVRSDWSKGGPPNFKGDISPDESGVWPGGEHCDFCTDERLRAVKSCLTCTASYCETHLWQHSLVPVRQRHTLVEATGNLEYRLCPQHHRALELFCNTDQMPICSLCPALTHRGHDVVCSEPGTQNDSYTKTVNEWIVQHHLIQASVGVPPPPGEIAFPTVGSDSVSLSWGSPEGMDTQSLKFRVTCISDTKQRSFKVTGANHINIQSLSPGKEYTFSVVTIGDKGTQSQSVSATVSTVIPTPVGLTIDSVTTTSFSLRWREPHGLDQTPSFLVSSCSPGTEPQFISTELHSTVLSDLQPSTQYTVSVCTVLENGEQSETVSKTLYTEPSPPESLNICYVSETSVCLSWDRNPYLEGVPYTFRVTWGDSTGQRESITTDENFTVLSHLRPVTEYSISVCIELQSSLESEPVHTTICTKPSPPESLRVEEVKSRSVRLCWDTPTDMEGVSYTFSITYTCYGEEPRQLMTRESKVVLQDLKPGMGYSVSICTVLHNGTRSRVCSAQAHTPTRFISPVFALGKDYGKLLVHSRFLGMPVKKVNNLFVSTTSVCLSWDRNPYLEGVPHTFRVTWGESTGQGESIRTDENLIVLSHLRSGTEYSISVCTAVLSEGLESEPAQTTVCTKPYPPGRLRVEEVKGRSVRLCWDTPTNMEGVSYTFNITYTCDGEEPRELRIESNSSTADLCDLKPGMEYSFSICTVLHNGTRSRVCSTQAHTRK